ncbi:zinc ABC transporter substrate-binding protein [Candidatus Kapabacteria bacterium]|nr:zinc ABC transporter substrate-binding protein [Candidatus Kapabacteria bacterium]
MNKISLLFLILCSNCFTKDIILTSSDPSKIIIEMIVGASCEVKTIRSSNYFDLNFEPTADDIYSSGTSKSLIFLSKSFEDWVYDVPSKNKIDISSLISDESKIYLNDSNIADFWWLDPKIIIDIIPKIADTLSTLYPENADTFLSNANMSINQMSILDSYIAGSFKKQFSSPIFEEFPALLYFAESYNIVYSDFLYFNFAQRNLGFNNSIIESLNLSKTKEFLSHQSPIDSTLNELSIKLKFKVLYIDIFPKPSEDYYGMMKRITNQLKRIYSN